MSSYDTISLIKQQCKALAKSAGIPLSSAQNQFAITFHFAHFHELTTVAAQNPSDPRLMMAAFGVTELEQAIWEDNLPSELEGRLEEAMSGETAATNAVNFSFEDLDIEDASYDPTTGKLVLEGSLTYSGEQDQDRVYHGSAFYLDVCLHLVRRGGKWQFDDNEEDALVIVEIQSDVDLDHQHEQEDQ